MSGRRICTKRTRADTKVCYDRGRTVCPRIRPQAAGIMLTKAVIILAHGIPQWIHRGISGGRLLFPCDNGRSTIACNQGDPQCCPANLRWIYPPTLDRYHVHFVTQDADMVFHPRFDGVVRLFVGKPPIAAQEPVCFIDAICPADGQTGMAADVIDLSVSGKEQVGEFILDID